MLLLVSVLALQYRTHTCFCVCCVLSAMGAFQVGVLNALEGSVRGWQLA